MARTLGFGLAGKILANPYPLGGYEGYEFGVSAEFISLDPVASLGAGSADKGDFTIYNLSFAKGIYRNVDIAIQFAPPFQQENISSYGVQGRWGFWESNYLPLVISAIVSGGGSNIQSLVTSNTISADLVVTMNMDDLALYFGGGQGRTITKFTGGSDGLNADSLTHQVDILESHSLFGVSVKVQRMFVAVQIDRYSETTYSAKIGYRY